MPKQSKLLLPIIIWAAVYLRLPAFFANHYHADEALFSNWARLIAIWRDPLLASQTVDKPPLLFYLQALFYPLLGPVEWASRMPDFAASLLLIPLIALLAWRLYRRQAIVLTVAILLALSPMAIQYAATAYTDPLLSAWLIMALALAAGRRHPSWAGFVFGLAVATKYQAWLFLPLIGGVAWLQGWDGRHWRGWAKGFLPFMLALFLWSASRSGPLDLWTNQMSNFGGVRLAYSWELLPRLQAWANLWQVAFGSSLLFLLLLCVVVGFTLKWTAGRKPQNALDLLLVLFLLGYAALHWLLAVPVWDRYMLPILPLAALLLARGLTLFADWILERNGLTRLQKLAPLALLLALMLFYTLPAAAGAREGQWVTGGRPSADHGAWQIAAFLHEAPYGTVLYDHWYSWHWRYHLLDTGVYVSWFAHPAALVSDLHAFADGPGTRYMVLPDGLAAQPVMRAVQAAGYDLEEVYETEGEPGMILYRVRR